MRTLIVSKTVMAGGYCIGGWTLDNRSVRLLMPGSDCHPQNTPFQVGGVWDLDFHPRQDITPPHIEDVIVTGREYLGRRTDTGEILRQRAPIWHGSPTVLYDGLLGWTSNGSGYVAQNRGLPAISTGFWIADVDLQLRFENGSPYYHYVVGYHDRRFKYVGTEGAIPVIPAGTLIRVSLARWWAPDGSDMEDRCYVQLSGWY